MQANCKGVCDTKIVASVKQLKHLNSYYKHLVILQLANQHQQLNSVYLYIYQ